MDIKFRYLPDSPPVFDTAKARARFAAAKADYLAGGSGPEVCERHGVSLRTFRWRAKKEGWRRADQPAPSLAPDPAPDPAPTPPSQDDPLVIPDAPTGASRDGTPAPPPLTAAQMVETCWSHIQTAVAAGRVIEARSWMRLYKDLKPFARDEEIAAREARMDREAAERRAAEATAEDEPLVIPEAPSGAIRDEDVALPLHCFSVPESSRTAPRRRRPRRRRAQPRNGSPALRHPPRRRGAAGRTGRPRRGREFPLHCFSPPESHHPGQGP